MKLKKQNQNNILCGWKPRFARCIELCGLNCQYANNMYTTLSSYVHNTNITINTVTYFFNNQEKFDKISMLCFLFIILSAFVNDCMHFWNIPKTLFTDDEYNLLCEFLSMGVYMKL